MVVERNEFQLKFGSAAPALTLWKNYLNVVQKEDNKIHVRMMTDISGSAYTLIVEQMHESFGEAEPTQCRLVQRNDWREFYQKFIPLCERSIRNFYMLQLEF